jgi:hypothetical protein
MQAVYAFLTDNKDLLEALSYLAALLGIPIFLFTFISNIRRERREADITLLQRRMPAITTGTWPS